MKESTAPIALQQFVQSGYRAKVIRIMQQHFSQDWAGREVDQEFYNDIIKLPICPMGEKGEYHTFVYDGPLFKQKVTFSKGTLEQLESTWRLHLNNIALEQR